jgi:hypothetical protein
MRLDANLNGIILGLMLGIGLFIATNWLVLKGGPTADNGEVIIGPHLSLLGEFFYGYQVTFIGSFIGFAYGLLFGYIVGFLTSQAYNGIAAMRDKRRNKAAHATSKLL